MYNLQIQVAPSLALIVYRVPASDMYDPAASDWFLLACKQTGIKVEDL